MTTAAQQGVRRGRKFDQVLEGARAVFLRDGFDGASVDDIAREAGVSKATLYAYFPDKQLLFKEICAQECLRQADEVEAEIDPLMSVEAMLTLAGERIAGFILSDFGQNACRLIVGEGARFPELARDFYRNGPGLVHDRLVHHLHLLVQKDALQIDDVDLAAEQFIQLCKAGLMEKLVFRMDHQITAESGRRAVRGAVQMFMARYGLRD
ncbi:TetR/AcrR family transcriptional regulator [Pseudorhodobacter sp. MZDSW-24AT]|uniref:TetR/AcrR family transcriptional regulator n=1 Tax=Pseudorhodobacter sp. MZDSW-24AT TaxID=2052957 RepID=UPI000C1DC77C|nr:TetR/AcrR family transcriptional regulator [Pseudorhodobacter sp. MZDSW-24AT]PJF09700.1 TetR/AcrR family transcriptional regulator [Pseudorhodobacter sp. MZDSW-24AT]